MYGAALGTPPHPASAGRERLKIDERATRGLLITTACGGAAACLGGLALVGWALDVPALRTLLPSAPATTPMTALLVVLLGVAVVIASRADRGARARAALAICIAVLAASAWIFAQYAFDLETGPERALLWDSVAALGGRYPGRPSPHTATGTALIALAIALMLGTNPRARRAGLSIALAGCIVPWLALFGYASVTSSIHSLPDTPDTGMSPVTAIALLASGAGATALGPAGGIPGLLVSRHSGGTLARWLLPAAAALPLVLGWLAVWEAEAGNLRPATVFALNWGLASALFASIVVWAGMRLDANDAERDSLLARLRESTSQIEAFNATLQERVEAMTAELSARGDELQQRAAALERSNIELLRFAYVVSHDLQTPLRGITGFVQLLKSRYAGRLSAEADEWIDQTVASTLSMQEMINDIFEYSRVDSQPRPFGPVDLGAIVDDVCATLAGVIRDSGARVTRDDLPTLTGDRLQLLQLMQNLIENAIKYRGVEPPRIHVSAEPARGEWTITVTDNGIGIEPRFHDEIFDVFRRLHPKQAFPGTGIGLAVCRRVVQRHNGRIWVESTLAEGSAFRVAMPVAGASPP